MNIGKDLDDMATENVVLKSKLDKRFKGSAICKKNEENIAVSAKKLDRTINRTLSRSPLRNIQVNVS